MRSLSALVLATIAATLLGCGGSPTTGAPATAAAGQVAPETDSTAATGEVAGVAERFLQAILRGDAASATRWLTRVAAERATANPAILSPLGMRFTELRVGEVRRLSDSEAIAQCLLQEAVDSPSEEVCCLLRRDSDGWRVMGLACDAGPGAEPAMIDFERSASPANPPGGPSPIPGADVVGAPIEGGQPARRTAEAPNSTDRR
ncbi:MAG: hypothetical protein ACRCT8_13330 [Lacipirellulaceae bacterium]